MKLVTPTEERLGFKIRNIGVDERAYYLVNKGLPLNVSISGLTPAQANIIKQEALAVDVDAAVARGVVNCSKPTSELCILAHKHGFKKLIEKLRLQPFGLNELAKAMENFLIQKETFIYFKNEIYDLKETKFMAILNLTPDSFSDGDKLKNENDIVQRINEIWDSGTNLIDIGGESTRPYSTKVDALEEWNRIKFAVQYAVKKGFKVSVDTYKAEVAKKALDLGVHMINDISGLSFDEKMGEVVSKFEATICLMHIKGTPQDMQINPSYNDVVDEVYYYLQECINKAKSYGIDEHRIIIDPGFGFGKSLYHNLQLLKFLSEFESLRKPIMVGLSKKSFVGELTGKKVEERTVGSKILETIAILNGANIIRSHDVDETNQLINIMNKLNG
jgi:dihydropteroate synthase